MLAEYAVKYFQIFKSAELRNLFYRQRSLFKHSSGIGDSAVENIGVRSRIQIALELSEQVVAADACHLAKDIDIQLFRNIFLNIFQKLNKVAFCRYREQSGNHRAVD